MSSKKTLSRIAVSLTAVAVLSAFGQESPRPPSSAEVASWPEEVRAFWYDGAALLFDRADLESLRELPVAEQAAQIENLLADPDPSTPDNELRRAIALRQTQTFVEFPSLADVRGRLLFLHGAPAEREIIDCSAVFVPSEIWTYDPLQRPLLLYQERPASPYALWSPARSKRVLYRDLFQNLLEQYHELRHALVGRRFDLQVCKQAPRVDKVTGIGGLVDYHDPPREAEVLTRLDPPADRARWAADVTGDAVAKEPPNLPIQEVRISFPARTDSRMQTRLLVVLPASAGLTAVEEGESHLFKVVIAGLVERIVEGEAVPFEPFRFRFEVPVQTTEVIALPVDRQLRAGGTYQVRLLVSDEAGLARARLARVFKVPAEPVPEVVEYDVAQAVTERLASRAAPGADSVLLVPPDSDVVLGLWRAEAIVAGERVKAVRFLLDGQEVFKKSRPPFSAELRIGDQPKEVVVRIEGLDEKGEVVASDEVALNQQRGELAVRIVEPARGGARQGGRVAVLAQVTVPEERRVENVEFRVNDEVRELKTAPPWSAVLDVPAPRNDQDIVYISVVATLDDGTRGEDIRFFGAAAAFLEEVEVDFVELYTAVTEGNRMVTGLQQGDFRILEDGRPQQIAKFEWVEDRPITIGITLDTSGSMNESLREAREAAAGFLHSMMTPKDRAFAVRFSTRAELLVSRTSDVGAIEGAMEGLLADGGTALYDGVMTSLYYFRGVRGRRALVLLSDGEDTASGAAYVDALEYARRSGVTIYTIGLRIGALSLEVRRKLKQFADETGGRSFFIDRAAELDTVYEEIESELRSQYLLAYTSDRPTSATGEFRQVEVKVKGRLKARTIKGYYP